MTAGVEVSANGLSVSFEISQCAGMTNELLARLKFHFERLERQSRYVAEVTNFMMSHRTSFELAAQLGTAGMIECFDRSITASEGDFGQNHWQTALLVGLRDSNQFCNGGHIHCFGRR